MLTVKLSGKGGGETCNSICEVKFSGDAEGDKPKHCVWKDTFYLWKHASSTPIASLFVAFLYLCFECITPRCIPSIAFTKYPAKFHYLPLPSSLPSVLRQVAFLPLPLPSILPSSITFHCQVPCQVYYAKLPFHCPEQVP